NFAGTSNGLDTSGTGGKTIDVKTSVGNVQLNNNETRRANARTTVTWPSRMATTASKEAITAGTLGMNVTGAGDIDVNLSNAVGTLGAKTANGNINFNEAQAPFPTRRSSDLNFAGTSNGLDTSGTGGKTIDVKTSVGNVQLNNN